MKFKKLICLATIALALFTVNIAEGLTLDQAKITLKIIDEYGQPVQQANVRIGFEHGTAKYHNFDGSTKEDGLFSASASCNSHVAFTISKAGYYESGGVYNFNAKRNFRWEPWNPEIVVVLRKIDKPVSMYARDTKDSRVEIPVNGNNVGFDLIAFDWVTPYGKGRHSDFVFRLDRRFVSWNDQDSDLTITFSERFDGIQHVSDSYTYSSLSLPKHAPQTSYKDKVNLSIHASHKGYATSYNTNFKGSDNYFFRVRSEKKDGRFLRGMYGKIIGPIEFSAVNSKTAVVSFKYYLNPDYSTNIEFDPQSNLFRDLRQHERVGIK